MFGFAVVDITACAMNSDWQTLLPGANCLLFIVFAVLYRLIIQRLRLYQSEMIKIGLLMIVGGAGMFTMFATFRCITFLTVPTLVTYPGRLFLNALMVQNVLEGDFF